MSSGRRLLRGRGTAESFSQEKLRQAPQKEDGEILCDPGWCVNKSDAQNRWDGNTHNIHTVREREREIMLYGKLEDTKTSVICTTFTCTFAPNTTYYYLLPTIIILYNSTHKLAARLSWRGIIQIANSSNTYYCYPINKHLPAHLPETCGMTMTQEIMTAAGVA